MKSRIKGSDIEQLEWNGEGLPPVGAKCEVRFRTEDDEWTDWFSNGKLKAGYDSKLWFSHDFGDCVYPAHDVEFRKPETQEEKKEREMAENGKALYELVQNLWCSVDSKYMAHPYNSPMVDSKTKEMYSMLAVAVEYRKGE
tara:strand:- start:2415 stop:2837 length:423 start_codon:yes stop_codon:yes gene_type:complete